MIEKVSNMLNKQKYGDLNWSIDKSGYKEFESYEEATSWGMEHYQEWGKNYKKICVLLNVQLVIRFWFHLLSVTVGILFVKLTNI